MTTNLFRRRFMEAAFGSAASWSAFSAGFVLDGANLNQRSGYGDIASQLDPAIPLKALSAWTFVAASMGVAPHMKIVSPPTWTNASSDAVGPFKYFVVVGTIASAQELLWFQSLDPVISVPAGDVLRVPSGIICRVRGL